MSPARLATIALILAAGCGEAEAPRIDARLDPSVDPAELALRHRAFLLDPPATVEVEGVGPVNIESTYIPGVVACENGNAPLEALKAQAVQARSYLYYYMAANPGEPIANNQSAQVYSCAHRPTGPGAVHEQAAAETAGEYLEFEGTIVAAFYVAGAIPTSPDASDPIGSCQGRSDDSDPTNTEKWVTYNWERTGCGIDQTPLGWVPADCRSNKANRGCASQNGETCLAQLGWPYQDMLTYYYGADIELRVTAATQPPDEGSDYDRLCQTRDDGDHCFDASTSVRCAAGLVERVADCEVSCGADGQCSEQAASDPCADRADGAHCADFSTRITCSGGRQSASQSCPHGCVTGICLIEASEKNGDNNGDNGGDNGGDNDGGGTGYSTGDFPGLVDTSRGLEGGCSTGPGAPGAPGSWWLAGLIGLVGLDRRRRG